MNIVSMILKDGRFTEENITVETMVLSGGDKKQWKNILKLRRNILKKIQRF